jgi:sugar-specific transcriptional regulator TrmB
MPGDRDLLLHEGAVQTLGDLGLSVLQAKVYLALVKSGDSTGRATAKAAKVASQDVYRILAELQDKGLVEKIIGKPNEYRPMPLEDGFSMLLQRRNKQTAELEKAAFEIFNAFQIVDNREEKSEAGDFVLIPQGEPIENRLARGLETAQANICFMNEFQEGMEWHEKNFESDIKALDKGIKIRDILSRTQKNYHVSKSFMGLLERKPGFRLRYIDFPPPAKLMIKDCEEVFISTTRKTNSLDYPCLWSNNPIMVQIIQQWYDLIWEKAVAPQKTREKQSTAYISAHRASRTLLAPKQA